MKFVLYEFAPTADRTILERVMPHDDPQHPDFSMEAVIDAGMDPDDERIWMSALSDSWGPHPEGSLVVCEDADTGRLFAIQSPAEGLIIHGVTGQ